jgi:transcriptional regulator with XRE-family HTH domain
MTFQQYLQYMIKKHKMRQTDLLSKLQLSHVMFEGLDCITLSRWCNNKTQPSLHKQLLIAYCLEKNLSFFIQHIETPILKSAFLKKFDTLFNKVESQYHRIGYTANDSTSSSKLSMKNVSTIEHRKLLLEFYSQMETYRYFFGKITEKNHIIRTQLFTITKGKKIIAHMSFIEDIKQFVPYFRQKLLIQPQKKSILINLGYYTSRKNFQLLIGHMYNHLIQQYSTFHECYISVRGKDFLFFLEQAGGTLILAGQETSDIGNIYLIQFDLKKLFADPFIFLQVQKNYASYQQLKHQLCIDLPS